MLNHYTRAALVTLAASTLLSACAGAGAQYVAPHGANRKTEKIEVAVTNNNWMDMDVYVLRGSARMRLGSVTSMTGAVFEVPRGLNVGSEGNLRLLADPVGSSQTYISDPILVQPGSRVVWSLENTLPLSSYRVLALNNN